MMAVALWSWGPVALWPCSALVLASAHPRASLGNTLACVRHVLSKFRMTTHLVRRLVWILDFKDLIAH